LTRQAGSKLERLHKVLAHAGVASRRECERLIEQGRVRVDGQVVRELGLLVDPVRSKIDCDGAAIRPEKKVYYLLNKPAGVVCSNADELGRPGAVQLLADLPYRLNTVGRLDKESEGLIIVTNDGQFTNLLTHPRYEVRKRYHVRVVGRVTRDQLEAIERGIHLAEGKVQPSRIRTHSVGDRDTTLEIELREGRNREIRRMLAVVGHPVKWLRRVAIGPITDPSLKPGKYRKLTREEVSALFQEAMARKKAEQGEQP
jgi:23S rRNA pseudouridine2605 synthase